MKSIITLLTCLMLSAALPGPSWAQEGGKAVALKAGAKKKDPKKLTPAEQHELAVKWVVSVISKVAPPGRKTYYVEAQETKEAAEKRYRSIAEDIIEVVYNPATKPIFGGKTGRAKTVTLMLGIALHESGFGRNVDYGVGKYARGDNGNSWCLMQMNVGKGRAWARGGGWNIKEDRPWKYGDKKEDIVPGASGPEMVKDRRKCFTEAMRLIKVSFRSCRHNTFKTKLAVYASGRCSGGHKGSKLRINTGIKMYEQSLEARKGWSDADVKTGVHEVLVARAEKAKKDKEVAAKKAKSDKKKAEKDGKDKSDDQAKSKKKAAKKNTGSSAPSSVADNQR